MKLETSIEQLITKKIDEQWQDQLDFLKTIVRFPTISGRERVMQLYLADYFSQNLKMKVDRFIPDIDMIASHPGFSPPEWSYEQSDIVIGSQKGIEPEAGRSLIFQAHADVVSAEPISEWVSDPWEPHEQDGRLYGRGVADMKAGLAAMVFAYKAIREAGYIPKADFMLQIVPDEERTGNGALATLEAGYRAEGALIPEPFGLKAAVAQVGALWFRVNIKTIQKDAWNQKQTNVIEKCNTVISALMSFEDELNKTVTHLAFSEQKKPINLNIGTIKAGDFASNEPIKATIEGRISMLPGEKIDDRKKELEEWLIKKTKHDKWFKTNPPHVEFFGFHAEGSCSDDSTPLFQELDKAHTYVTHELPKRRTLPSTTDARFFHLYYDIDAICYGPEGGQFHEVNEWVDLESVRKVTKVYAIMLANWCGLSKVDQT
ncbi:ArgE/DapE family deacylase [Shouchella patagoniensis]|uniref:ArgE/DapE family deacylase n=1 Tax=Shouchella patagoniensis TaxID=228576 RepID=UPI000995A059|nr:ArgE/DapE family deacylase [Shouchella patagoniensis]